MVKFAQLLLLSSVSAVRLDHNKEMIPVNDNYLEYVSDLANQNEMRPSSHTFVDQSIVNDAGV
jgi:hypothetical protein